MVKRHKQEEIAGVLEFEGRTSEDPEIVAWLAEHKAQKRGKIRVSQGGTGVRVMFSEKADMASWKARAEQAARGRKPPIS
jgi:hypothetical protein